MGDALARQLVIEYRAIETLRPYERNARTHSEAQIGQIVAAICEFGFTSPLLVDDDGGVMAGHGRLAAAKVLAMASVPCIAIGGLTDAQRRALILADNKLALNAGWDEGLLALELADLTGFGFDLGLAGFDAAELAALMRQPGATDPDDVPPVPVVPVSRLGDLWLMGSHRLMAGDCREAVQMARLLNGRALNLAVTSPPYAEQRDYDVASGFKPIPPAEYVEWFAPVAANIAAALAADGSWFVNIKPTSAGLDTNLYVLDLVIAHVRSWGWHFATEFCWERNGVPKAVTQRFKNQFEPVYQFVRGRWKMNPDAVRHASNDVPTAGGPGVGNTTWKNAQGGIGAAGVAGAFGAVKKRSNLKNKDGSSGGVGGVGQGRSVNEYGEAIIGPGLAYPGNRLPTFTSSHEALGHAAAFPVGLPEFFIKAYTDEGDAVFDPFMGSGSSLMACERTGRAGFGMELSPLYVDIAVARWQNYTGKKAVRESDGMEFDDARSQTQTDAPEADPGEPRAAAASAG